MENLSAKELRIGNWIRHKYSRPDFIVSEINAFSENNTVNGIALCDCEPIPLTEEWLTKFGYQLNDWRFSITKPANYDGFLLCDGYAVITDRIKYVHELQNLYFALTGSELELKTKTL